MTSFRFAFYVRLALQVMILFCVTVIYWPLGVLMAGAFALFYLFRFIGTLATRKR